MITVPAKIHELDLSDYTNDYINPASSASKETEKLIKVRFFPIPANNTVFIKMTAFQHLTLSICNNMGKIVDIFDINSSEFSIDVSRYGQGIYYYSIQNKSIIMANGKFIIE